jgi:S-DNA-T family DNA segregation ATPase FtsK/SpoIIIE
MDPLAVNAMRMGYDYGGLSISAVQTKLAIGYPRAARIVNWLVDNGYVTPNSIAGKKQMILPKEEFEEKFGNNG